MNQHLHDFSASIEERLWKEFESEMDQDYKQGEWLYSGETTSKGYPADLGYYMGYKIIESYYYQFEDEGHAIRDMLSSSNYVQLFERSTYANKFK